MKSRLTPEEQLSRFGMTHEAALALRDRVSEKLLAKDTAKARAAWQELAYELRGNKGGPMMTKAHPESIRFSMLKALDEGKTIEEARAHALAYARGEAQL